MAALYSVTLGLIAMASWQNYSGVESLVSKEASTIGVLYRDVGGYPEPLCTELRHGLREYAVFLIEKTWPAATSRRPAGRRHHRADATSRKDTGLRAVESRAVGGARGKPCKFNELIDLRRQRVDRVDEGLPMVLWVVVTIGGVLTLSVTYFFWIEDVRFHVLLLSMLSVFVALMVYLIAALDRPFRGSVSVTPESYALIIQRVMDPIDALHPAR